VPSGVGFKVSFMLMTALSSKTEGFIKIFTFCNGTIEVQGTEMILKVFEDINSTTGMTCGCEGSV
jgi:hypothetical protein